MPSDDEVLVVVLSPWPLLTDSEQDFTRESLESHMGAVARPPLPRIKRKATDLSLSQPSQPPTRRRVNRVSRVSLHVLFVLLVAQANPVCRFVPPVLVMLLQNDLPILQDGGGRKLSSTSSGHRGVPE